jgi:hypothetical protein
VSRCVLRVTLLSCVALSLLSAQQSPVAPARRGLPVVTDSVRMLPGAPFTFDSFFDQVSRNHPVVRQARLIAEGAAGDVTSAWGNFEPKLDASWARKQLQSSASGSQTLYYDYADIALKIPTPFGADFKMGYERASGQFINPQLNTSNRGLFTAGFTIPLGQRILTDDVAPRCAWRAPCATWPKVNAPP